MRHTQHVDMKKAAVQKGRGCCAYCDRATKPVAIGLRSVGWPDYEVEAVTAARVAGQPDEAIRALVNKLHAQRAERFEALTQTVAHA